MKQQTLSPYDWYVQEVMEGQWFKHEETGMLYILPVPDATRESIGPDDEVMDQLNEWSRRQNGTVRMLQWESLGLEPIHDWQRRYEPLGDYYYFT